ncbi:efflux transporter, RND family, MFP subunit [Novosphingobium sp. Rr 2-17]|uniref:efflux RND transporter periplasmic adaptor subunit n=1 Tax=Novosphingobium sp. Rr 2-17 TaxID=555793 RepID=UPI000269A533|nr:efflux RND transporter periplasmic adaptor subunit [Novosphingobium sp. Rr 2-17]EIZ78510.1 efflux transporter, RND family, MFP subunit [Novosphingobium sp. Rr 2-17]
MRPNVHNFAQNLAMASALALATVSLAGCGQKQEMTPPETEVGIVTLKAEPVTVTTSLSGRTNAVATAEVRPQVDGIIKDRLFQEGSLVRAGQALYQIDPRRYQASLDTSRAQLENAKATLYSAEAKVKRYNSLSDKTAVSAQDFDETVATARASRASVHQYEASSRSDAVNLEFTRVTAPITGRIGRSAYTKGALVTSGQSDALATIQQLDPIYVDITQSSADLLRLRRSLAKGDLLPSSTKVKLTLEDGTTYEREGTIEFSEVTVDTQTGTVTIRAKFANPDGYLLPGMFVRVVAPQGMLSNGILAPQQGISRDAKGEGTALVVNAQGKVEQRTVVTGQAIGTKWLITSGLKAGDRLIVEGSGKVAPGAKVKAVAAKLSQ